MRNVNLTIKNLDVVTEDFICDFIDRLGYSYDIREVKTPKEKKEKSLVDIFNKIRFRFDKSNFSLSESTEKYTTCFSVVTHPKKGYAVGSARMRPGEKYNYVFGYYLSLVRACGWKDLEKELLDTLN